MRRREKHMKRETFGAVGGETIPELSYQEAILRQSLPVLSPIRGTNQQQGVYGITDAISGTTLITYDPNIRPAEQNVPTNVSSGSTNASAKIHIINRFTPKGERKTVSEGFASRFN
jgi:hypothetical protein